MKHKNKTFQKFLIAAVFCLTSLGFCANDEGNLPDIETFWNKNNCSTHGDKIKFLPEYFQRLDNQFDNMCERIYVSVKKHRQTRENNAKLSRKLDELIAHCDEKKIDYALIKGVLNEYKLSKIQPNNGVDSNSISNVSETLVSLKYYLETTKRYANYSKAVLDIYHTPPYIRLPCMAILAGNYYVPWKTIVRYSITAKVMCVAYAKHQTNNNVGALVALICGAHFFLRFPAWFPDVA